VCLVEIKEVIGGHVACESDFLRYIYFKINKEHQAEVTTKLTNNCVPPAVPPEYIRIDANGLCCVI